MKTRDYLRYEMIGEKAKVIDAKNKALLGIEGRIVDETRNTVKIQTAKGEKTLLKSHVTLEMVFGKNKVVIDGKKIIGRSEDRIKKK